MPHVPAVRATTTLALLVSLAAAQLSAQSAPTVELAKRTGRSKYTFGAVFGVQEIPDGRVVASDSKENAFRVVDFAKGDMALLGTQGDDPENYRMARNVMRLPGDSLLLYDPGSRQFLHVSPKGEIQAFTKMPAVSGPNKVSGSPLAVDASGALYFLGPIEFDSARTMNATVAVRRLPADGDLSVQDLGRINARRSDQVKVTGLAPYLYRDAWALRSDGLAARVVADTYQVIWSRDGKETGRTGPIPYQPIPLTVAEQQAFHDSVVATMQTAMQAANAASAANSGAPIPKGGGGGGGGAPMPTAMGGGGQTMIFTMGGAAGGAAPMPMAGGGAPMTMTCTPAGCTPAGGGAPAPSGMTFNPANIQIGAFPENKPPIIGTSGAALFDPNGLLWIVRERAHTDPIPHIDIVAEGRGVIAHLNLPEKTRVVGFGKGVVYLAHLDGQEEYLERYPLPKF